MASTISRKIPLAELHCHLGAAVTPAIMWSIAHAQGIKLPTRDYWEFRDLITVHPRRPKSFDGYLQLFHWTELIQSSPIAVERAVYEVIGGAYRKNNITTTELRFNPMKRNRGGEQDLDHIIAAAVRGMDRATLEYPVKPGLIFCLDRAFPFELNEIIAEKAIAWRDRGVVGVDIAGPESATFRVADYRRVFRRARQHGLGITVHTGESGPVEEMARVMELLEPDRIGHGVKAAYDPRTMAMIRERGIVLEICPTSNLNTGVVSGWDEFRWIFDQFHRNDVRYTISTDGPEMLKTYIRDELVDAQPARDPVAGGAGADRRDLDGRVLRAQRVGRAPAPARARAAQGRGARGGLGYAPATSRPALRLHRARDPVRAAAVARRDVPFAHDVRAQHAAEQVELRPAGRRVEPGDVQDRAVVLQQVDAVRVHARLGDVAQLVLETGELPDAVLERRAGRQPRIHPIAQARLGLAAPGREDVLDQVLAADLEDRGQEPRRQPVVVGREQVLGVGGDVVQVARPPHAVADRGPRHEAGHVQGPELLGDAAAARPDGRGDDVGRGRADPAQVEEDRPAQDGRARPAPVGVAVGVTAGLGRGVGDGGLGHARQRLARTGGRRRWRGN